MKIRKITLQNIRSYKNGEILFPSGSTLLAGDIGSGKTTILLALEFALFGLQPGQRGSSLLSNGERSGSVILECELGENIVEIERTLVRGSKTVSQEDVFITVNGVREQLAVSEIKNRVLEALNYPTEFAKKTNLLYRYTVYSPQEEMKEIITEDPESRLNTIRHIFGIDKYRRIQDNAQLLSAGLREEVRGLTYETKTIDSDKERLELFNKRLIESGARLKELASNFDILTPKRIEVEQEMSETREKIEERRKFEKEIEKSQVLLGANQRSSTEKERTIAELHRKISYAIVEISSDNLDEKIHAQRAALEDIGKKYIEALTKMRSLDIKEREYDEKMRRVFDLELCPTCLQDVSSVHKHNIKNECESTLVNIKKEKALIELSINSINAEKKLIEKRYAELVESKSQHEVNKVRETERDDARKKLEALQKEHDTIKEDTKMLEQHIVSLKNSVLEFSKYETKYRLKESELREIVENQKIIEIKIAQLKREQELVHEEMNALNERLREKAALVQKVVRLGALEQWLSTDFLALVLHTEKNVMTKLREEFSRLFNRWFLLLATEDFSVQLDENFTPIIIHRGFETDYSYLSGGERTAVALAYRLALNQVINSMLSTIQTRDILILDEPTDGFSEQQLDKVRDILEELALNQLILVSHEQKIEGFVDNVIRLSKAEGATSISTSISEKT